MRGGIRDGEEVKSMGYKEVCLFAESKISWQPSREMVAGWGLLVQGEGAKEVVVG